MWRYLLLVVPPINAHYGPHCQIVRCVLLHQFQDLIWYSEQSQGSPSQNDQQKMYKYMTNINRPTNLFCTANIVKKLLMMTNILTLKPLN